LVGDLSVLDEREARSSHHQESLHTKGEAHLPEAEMPAQIKLSARTVWRWLDRYQQSQQDIRSLVPSYHQRGPRQSQMSPLLTTLLQQAIQQTSLTNVRAPVTPYALS
jgi:hypothetical protein